MTRCASCGLPGHRYGRNEGMERYDPMACINQLRGKLEDLVNGERVEWCEEHEALEAVEEDPGFCWRYDGDKPCRIVSKLLIDPAVADARRTEEEM